MAGDLAALLTDLTDETEVLAAVVSGAGAGALDRATPAEGWSVADTIGHLWFFDREGRRALEDPDDFTARLDGLIADPDGYMATHLAEIRDLGDEVLSAWLSERDRIIAALRDVDPSSRVPWYGPSMSPMSFATARLMETWAHGQDVVDALGAVREPTDRLRHVAHLGVRTRGFSYAVRGRHAPETEVYVALTSPSGELWTWGDAAASDRVEGPAVDFCLLVTQRRHLEDLSLTVTGDAAAEWLSIAQAFAGGDTLTDPSRSGMPAT